MLRFKITAFAVAGLLVLCRSIPIHAAENITCPLVASGKAVCEIVIADSKPAVLIDRAAATIADTVKRWAGVSLPVVRLDGKAETLPEGPAIVLTTFERLRRLLPSLKLNPILDSAHNMLMRSSCIDEQGFVCVPMGDNAAKRMVIVSRTPRGVYNGAEFVRDYWIDGTKDALSLQLGTVVRSPQMAARGVYMLTFWAYGIQYDREAWKKMLDTFARDGMERVYFWVSGHFPSKKYPQANFKNSKIGTLDDLRALIRYSHDLGVKFYLGSGIFGWAMAYNLTEDHPETYLPTPRSTKEKTVKAPCPSHPLVRQRHLEYFIEMVDALPEADGLFLETRDEYYGCTCATCNKIIDESGSKQYGQSEISLLQEIAQAVWEHHPHIRISWMPGQNTHRRDVAYFNAIRQLNDPRFEWMESGEAWTYIGPEGEFIPIAFSQHVVHFDYYCVMTLEKLNAEINRITREGLYGYVPTFLHGSSMGDFEHYKQIPYPTDWIPYVVTGLAFKELTWQPYLTNEVLRKRIRHRFFGEEASRELGADLCSLRDLFGLHSTQKMPKLKDLPDKAYQELNRIELNVKQARPTAGPKTAETLDLMQRAIDAARKHFDEKRREGVADNP